MRDPWPELTRVLAEDEDRAEVEALAYDLALAELERCGAAGHLDFGAGDPGNLLECVAASARLEAERQVRDRRLQADRARGEAVWRDARRRMGLGAPVLTGIAASLFRGERPSPMRVW